MAKERIDIRVSAEALDRVDAMAVESGLNRSEVIRALLKYGLLSPEFNHWLDGVKRVRI